MKINYLKNYFSKLTNEYEPYRSFFYICKFKLYKDGHKYISIVLPLFEVEKYGETSSNIYKMKFCALTLEFDTESLDQYIYIQSI